MSKRHVYNYSRSKNGLNSNRVLSALSNLNDIFYLNSNSEINQQADQECIIGVGNIDQINCSYGSAFSTLEKFQQKHQDWMFGWLSYDLKNELEDLSSNNPDKLEFPDLYFIVPEQILIFSESTMQLHTFLEKHEADQFVSNLLETRSAEKLDSFQSIKIVEGNTQKEYLEKANQFKQHIQRGDIYEANYCTQFSATSVSFNSYKAYKDLNKISEPPFSAWIKSGDYEVVSASPERYLKKEGSRLISQPIKGTATRHDNVILDNRSKDDLLKNPKERSENVMIVDLVRNDLSKTAIKGSVNVSELYGIYSFKQVHHMISTIESELDPENSSIDAIKTTFPMGSMTGAPKVSAMKIIEENESFKRGLYSGAIGYFKPNGDFDFNVVIRTILYNNYNKNLAFAVGSAITIAADPKKEYQECLLKARALFETLEKQGIHKNQNDV